MSSAFPLRLRCPQCKTEVYFPSDRAGTLVICPNCLEEFLAETPDRSSDRSSSAPANERSAPHGTGDALLRLEEIELESRGRRDILRPQRLDAEDLDGASGGPNAAGDYEFDVECLLCGTRQDAVREQIGRTIQCPDCHGLIEVREPPPKVRRPRTKPDLDQDGDVRLSEPVEAKPFRVLAQEMIEAAARAESARSAATGAHSSERETSPGRRQKSSEEKASPPWPDRPLTGGLFRFLAQPVAVVRWILFALALQIELGCIELASRLLTSGSPVTQFFSAMLIAFAFLFGFMLLLSWSINMLAILQETAAGNEYVENWPGSNFVDWSSDALYVLAGAFVGVLPGVLFGQVILCAGGSLTFYFWSLAVCCSLSTVVLFPIALLSLLETGSLTNVVSRPVWRSVRLVWHRWRQFWGLTAGLPLVVFLVWKGRVLNSMLVNGLLAVVMVGTMMLYFRLLGRLSWHGQEAAAEEASRDAGLGAKSAGAEPTPHSDSTSQLSE